MKKLLIFFALFFIASTISCSDHSSKETPTEEPTEKKFQGGVIVDTFSQPLYCETLSQYQTDCLNSADIVFPENFVTYQQLSSLGAFECFSTYISLSDKSFDEYTYYFINGLYFQVIHRPLIYTNDVLHPMNKSTMFYADNKVLEYETLKVEDEIYYFYSEGCLNSIVWISNGRTYTLGITRDDNKTFPFDIYKKDKLKDYEIILQNSIVSDFFYTDTVSNAVSNFDAQLYGIPQS